jgi:hypothetical protein
MTNLNPVGFKTAKNKIYIHINKWFRTNLSSLNFKKTHRVDFGTRNSNNIDISIRYSSKSWKSISITTNTKFWGIIIDDTTSWECHIFQIMSKLSPVCFEMRSIKYIMSQDTLQMKEFSYIHPIINYGTTFW